MPRSDYDGLHRLPGPRQLLPHEWLFGALLLLIWIRLVLTVGPRSRDALTFLSLLLVNVALIAATWSRSTNTAWRARLAFHPIAIGVVFQQLGTAIPAVNRWRADEALLSIDQAAFGGTPSVMLQPFANAPLTELFSLCYLLFFPYLVFSIVRRFLGSVVLFAQFCVGLFTLYAIGFLGYLMVPAAGPHLAMAHEFSAPLSGWKVSELNAALIRAGSNGVDVFPSLHCAVPAFLLAFDWRHARRRFWCYLPWCIGLWLSTIYLRYHYFADLVAGFALAALAVHLSSRHTRRLQTEGVNSQR